MTVSIQTNTTERLHELLATRILILDDSLSAVDTYTEETILHNLRDVREFRDEEPLVAPAVVPA